MFSLEERLRPRPGPHAWARDLLGLGLLLALAAMLAPTLGIDLSAALGRPETADQLALRNHQLDLIFRQVTEQMASVLLLMSLGFLLCLRVGAVDLSVWAAAGLGGLLPAWLINAGIPPGLSLAAAPAAGAIFGAVNGLLVAAARLPSIAVTPATGLLLIGALQARCHDRSVPLPDDAFAGWHIVQTVTIEPADQADSDAPRRAGRTTTERVARPLYLTRCLLVAAVYAACMLAILAAGRGHAPCLRPDSPWLLPAALCASGALAAAGGALWLLDHNRAPVPTRLVDDLRVPTAAILAGGLFFAGRGRTLLAAVCLPAALLLAGIWRQYVWNLPAGGYLMQLALLAGALIVAQAAVVLTAKSPPGRRLPPALAAVFAAGAILTLAAAANFHHATARLALHAAGAALSALAAAVLAAVFMLQRKRRPRTAGR